MGTIIEQSRRYEMARLLGLELAHKNIDLNDFTIEGRQHVISTLRDILKGMRKRDMGATRAYHGITDQIIGMMLYDEPNELKRLILENGRYH